MQPVLHSGGPELLGPGAEQQLHLNAGISDMLRSHSRYLSGLSVWNQYLVWRYTMGSGQVNMLLLKLGDPGKRYHWVRQFLQFYNWRLYGLDKIEEPFNRWEHLFREPKLWQEGNDELSQRIIALYAERLQQLVLDAPRLTRAVVVYKASNPYPGMPQTEQLTQVVDLPQAPFNSTSYDPQFNYGAFLMEGTLWAMFRLVLPVGTACLSLNPTYHAWPFEREILLPAGCSFRVQSVNHIELDFIPKEAVQYEQVQTAPLFVIGEVFRPKPGVCQKVERRPMHLLGGEVVNPAGVY